MFLPRRRFLQSVASGAALAGIGAPAFAMDDQALLSDLSRRTFDFFWETTDPKTGLAPDRWPSPAPSSIAAVGFALTAYPIGVENGWITRDAARTRVLTTLRYFHDLPQGPAAEGVAGHMGFFYHFLDMQTGLRANRCELSTVDTTLLLGGVLFCASWFDREHTEEAEIRKLADTLYGRVDWAWAVQRKPLISMGWTPEHGWIKDDWRGYCEGMLIYILALASPTHPVGPEAWTAWCDGYGRYWKKFWGQEHLTFGPLFGHQYSHVWVDFRGVQDPYMRAKGLDYFENSRRSVLAQKAYANANPGGWRGYGDEVWGLTASDGPGPIRSSENGQARKFTGYSARGLDTTGGVDDGTLAPTAAAASLPFAPEAVIPTIRALKSRYPAIYGRYGFLDAFNPSMDRDAAFERGRLDETAGWVDTDYLGIDQGPILAMIENWRSGLVWKVMRANPHIRLGMQRAGFTGGWLSES